MNIVCMKVLSTEHQMHTVDTHLTPDEIRSMIHDYATNLPAICPSQGENVYAEHILTQANVRTHSHTDTTSITVDLHQQSAFSSTIILL